MKCGETGKELPGIKHLTTKQLARLPKHKRTVARAYGGVYCAKVVKERIINAFMDEESKFAQQKQEAKAAQEKKGK